MLQARLEFCRSAFIATGDWDTLLRTDAENLPSLLAFRAARLVQHGQMDDVAAVAEKLQQLAATADEGPDNQQKGGMLYNAACAHGLCAKLAAGWDGRGQSAPHRWRGDRAPACRGGHALHDRCRGARGGRTRSTDRSRMAHTLGQYDLWCAGLTPRVLLSWGRAAKASRTLRGDDRWISSPP